MQGKTTFILKDADTGRMVEKFEEHNMFTNAVRDIFRFPSQLCVNSNFSDMFSAYFPLYKNLLSGLVLFNENIPENADDYFINGRFDKITATAAGAYTGSDLKRGTLNQNLSGELENGYRFVWEFSSERANGMIKCASLTNKYIGQRGSRPNGTSAPTFLNAYSFSTEISKKLTPFINHTSGGYFVMQSGNHDYYFYSLSSRTMTFYRAQALDEGNISVLSKIDYTARETFQIQLPLDMRTFFADPDEKKVYCFGTYKSDGHTQVCRCVIDIENRTVTPASAYIDSGHDYGAYSSIKAAYYGGKFYMGYEGTINIFSSDGVLENSISSGFTTLNSLTLGGGKLWAAGYNSRESKYYYLCIEPDGSFAKLDNMSDFYMFFPIQSRAVEKPYYLFINGENIFTMIRTDYLATINNLSVPFEKTDRHALQIIYDVTE